MTTPSPPDGAPPRQRGTHRVEPARRSIVVPVVAAVAVVAALALAGYMLLTSGSDESQTAGPVASTTGQGSPSARPTGHHSGSHSAQPSGQPSGHHSGKPSHKPTHKPTKNPSHQAIPQIPVYVFNQTTTTGLAALFGSQLQTEGWNVVGIDNWRGFVPENTVYYYPGDKAAAEQLSHDFPDIGRVWPASSPMPGGALTVILATTGQK